MIAVKNDRRRLELAAALRRLNDELLDTLSRQAILALRQRDAVLKHNIVLTGKLSQELRANANNPRLAAKLADLEKQAASTDAATQQRLAADLQKAKSRSQRLKEASARCSETSSSQGLLHVDLATFPAHDSVCADAEAIAVIAVAVRRSQAAAGTHWQSFSPGDRGRWILLCAGSTRRQDALHAQRRVYR